ncbi:MAG TPA: hypothetical protein DDW27_12615 [Bacteroidales bacterium]|nr:hypothetical protein [Bacteroidales bacterium]
MDKIINAEAFEAFLVKAFKFTTEELASLYNEAGELTEFTSIERKDAERISKLSADKTNQYNRGLKEGAMKLEKELKEKYEVESDLIGIELFDHVIETKIADVESAKPEEVLKHPEVIKALNEKDKLLKAKDKELIDKLKAKEDEINSANLFKEVESFGLAEFDNLNPILPEDARKAKALKDVLVGELKKYKYQRDADGFIVLKEDSTPLLDDHGNHINFKDHIKGHAEKYFDFKTAEDRSSSGLKPVPGQGNKVRKPKDEADYQSMMKDPTLTPKQKIEIKDLHIKN